MATPHGRQRGVPIGRDAVGRDDRDDVPDDNQHRLRAPEQGE